MPKVGCNFMIFRTFDIFSHIFHLVCREDEVRVDGYERGLCAYHAERRLFAATSASKVIAVDTVGQIVIRVGVEPVRQFLALIALIRGSPVGKQRIRIRFLLLPDIPVFAPI